ncbi:unnamed protein product [Gadus morhua 'NCC']
MTITGKELNSTDKHDMEITRAILYMSDFAVFLINGPLLVLNLMANIFFVFCLMTRKTQQVKQPLTILLGSMVSFTILYVFSVTLLTCVLVWVKSNVVIDIAYTIVIFLSRGNMTTYVWLMFYYYIMIVPSQRALFLWVKKNIKSIIYIVLILDRLFFLGVASFQVTLIVDHFRFPNGTEVFYNEIDIVWFSIVSTYKFIFICVMMISCFATAHYLNKHMKSLSASDGSLSSPRLHSQIRVTVAGILQGVLCFLCGIWNLVYVMIYYLSPYFYFGSNITFTVVNLYISGTTVNLGVGQTLFREKAIHVWKAVNKRLCTGKSSKDIRPP